MDGFAAAEILSSNDGISYTKVEACEEDHESEQQRADRLAAQLEREAKAARPFKSLREQLQEQKEAKKAEWYSLHNPNKPPPGVSEEEYSFLQESIEAAKQQSQLSKQQAIKDRHEFEAKLALRKRQNQLEHKQQQPNHSLDIQLTRLSMPLELSRIDAPTQQTSIKSHKGLSISQQTQQRPDSPHFSDSQSAKKRTAQKSNPEFTENDAVVKRRRKEKEAQAASEQDSPTGAHPAQSAFKPSQECLNPWAKSAANKTDTATGTGLNAIQAQYESDSD